MMHDELMSDDLTALGKSPGSRAPARLEMQTNDADTPAADRETDCLVPARAMHPKKPQCNPPDLGWAAPKCGSHSLGEPSGD